MKQNRIKRVLAVVLASGMVFTGIDTGSMQVYATGEVASVEDEELASEDEELTPEEKQQKEYEEKLKKAYELPVQTNELEGWPQAVGTYGDAAIVMDAESGAILYAKNIDKQEYPASITKLLTALLAYEYDVMDQSVEITAECQGCLGAGYAHIGSDVGDVLTMEQAMHAMLLASSNDIAYAIGETVAKSQGKGYEWFIEEMNRKCKELGGVNSNFINTNGVFDETHYSCALDMALIGKALFEYPEFFELCQTLQYTIPASDRSEEHVFQQKHEMLIPGDSDYYEYVIGGKTGYTTEAQNTLVTMADNGNLKLVCVVLYEYPGHVYTDTQALLEYGFTNFSNIDLRSDPELASLEGLPENVYATLPEGIEIDDLERDITNEGDYTYIEYKYKDTPVASYMIDYQELAAIEAAEQAELEAKEKAAAEARKQERHEKISKILKIIGIIVGILIISMIALISYVRAKKERQRKERLRRRREARRRAEMEGRMDPPVRRNTHDVHRKHSRSQNMPRDRRPKNRRYD